MNDLHTAASVPKWGKSHGAGTTPRFRPIMHLFTAYINDMPSALRCRKLLYADDIVLWKTGKEAAALQNALQTDLHTISAYCEKWQIKVSTTKTVWSIFSLGIDILKAPFELTLSVRRLCCDNSPK